MIEKVDKLTAKLAIAIKSPAFNQSTFSHKPLTLRRSLFLKSRKHEI
ncbi:MAG: hypothetical protein WCP16_00835 [Pseudanabaena sp. ELA645]